MHRQPLNHVDFESFPFFIRHQGIKSLCDCATSFAYVVSTQGVTGSRTSMDLDLPSFIGRIRKYTNLPLAVGFGVSNREHYCTVAQYADGVIIGSKIIQLLKSAGFIPYLLALNNDKRPKKES